MTARLRTWLDAARRHPHRTVAVLATLAFVVGAAIAKHSGTQLHYVDERDYVDLARHLADGLGYSNGVTPTAFRPPAWPAVISVVDLLGGGIVATRFLAVACFCASIVGLYELVRRVAGTDAGLLAATLLTCYPLSLYTATTLYPESLALLLVTTGMLATVLADRTERTGTRAAWAAGAGASFGVLGLTAPAYLVLAGTAVVWVLWRRCTIPRVTAIAVPLVLVTLVPLVGWGMRNQAELGSFVPTSTNGGVNLLLGNNPHATPTTGVDADISTYVDTALRRKLDEVETDRYFRDEAIRWIRNNPADAATLYLGKLANFFNYRSKVVTESRQSGFTDLLGAVTFYPLVLLFFVRLAFFRKLPLARGEGLLASSYLLYALTAAVFFTRIRFRVPVDQLMMGVVASGAVAWWRSQRSPVGADADASPDRGLAPAARIP